MTMEDAHVLFHQHVLGRRLIAERLGWPDGAAADCESIERQYPDLRAAWFPENTCPGFERPAGFYAWLAGANPGHMAYHRDGTQVYVRRFEYYGATLGQLEQDIRRPATFTT